MHWRAWQRILNRATLAFVLLALPVLCYVAQAAGVCALCDVGLCPCCWFS